MHDVTADTFVHVGMFIFYVARVARDHQLLLLYLDKSILVTDRQLASTSWRLYFCAPKYPIELAGK